MKDKIISKLINFMNNVHVFQSWNYIERNT